MARTNCWEYTACGREPGGARIQELGPCVTPTALEYDGVNGGESAGRVCWAIAGTMSGAEPACLLTRKLGSCMQCGFYKLVTREEPKMVWNPRIQQKPSI